MSNFCIGDSYVDPNTDCTLTFHQYTIYDSASFGPEDGTVCWSGSAKQFVVIPNAEISELLKIKKERDLLKSSIVNLEENETDQKEEIPKKKSSVSRFGKKSGF